MYKIAALYSFVLINDPQDVSDVLNELCKTYNILGAIIVAKEGFNGTISGLHVDLDKFLEDVSRNIKELFTIDEIKMSECSESPFHRIRVRVKSEIVTMGYPDINPSILKGLCISVTIVLLYAYALSLKVLLIM